MPGRRGEPALNLHTPLLKFSLPGGASRSPTCHSQLQPHADSPWFQNPPLQPHPTLCLVLFPISPHQCPWENSRGKEGLNAQTVIYFIPAGVNSVYVDSSPLLISFCTMLPVVVLKYVHRSLMPPFSRWGLIPFPVSASCSQGLASEG